MRFVSLVLLAALALVPTARAADVTINVQNFSFEPAHVVVNPGDTITYQWISGAHTATNGSGLADPNLGNLFDATLDFANTTFQWVVPDTPAVVIPFLCRPHSFVMVGTITVEIPAPVAQRHDVIVRDFEFDPAQLSIDVGDTVCWTWESGVHTTTSGSGSNPVFNPGALWSEPISAGTPEFCYVFGSEGTYPYFCIPHEFMDMRGVVVVGGSTTGIADRPGRGIAEFQPPFPNPSGASVNLVLSLAARTEVRLDVFDLRGRRVATVHDGDLGEGLHALVWDGRADHGRFVGAGVYFARLRAGEDVLTHKILRIENDGHHH
jgi:plastocyanin